MLKEFKLYSTMDVPRMVVDKMMMGVYVEELETVGHSTLLLKKFPGLDCCMVFTKDCSGTSYHGICHRTIIDILTTKELQDRIKDSVSLNLGILGMINSSFYVSPSRVSLGHFDLVDLRIIFNK